MLCETKHLLSVFTTYWIKFQLDKIHNSLSCRRVMDSLAKPDITRGDKRPMLDGDNENEIKIQKTEERTIQRIKRKNHVIMLGYLGKNYYGMQRNPGMKTIEEDLVNALLKANLITTEHFENLRVINFQRAARTDKGVSAVRQIVSLKLQNPDKTIINQFLPDVIRVFGIKRVTKGFNSKNQCDARTYRYIIPSFTFALENRNLLKIGEDVDTNERIKQLSTIDGKPYIDYRLSAESLNKLNSILKLLEGTHNFHNFTSKTKPLDPRARRYIISFRCVDTFVSKDMEFVVLEIKGQSFMLHQIRKMVAIIIAVARNIIPEETINEAFKMDKMEIPIAPSLGLCLCHVHYDNYAKRYGTDGMHETLDWKECEEEVEKFQKEHILRYIIDTEISENTTLKWIAALPEYSFSNMDDLPMENGEKEGTMDNDV
ncbi:tRNA pseudouridine synthase A isoform X2 [Odontomachus brunneus]|uniref:tRNA pseudouridine synthase A isoform X2 n=1 Tax=Odontomachus brunneus TaxID=486640 RepID=UPI0013F2508B|nr:tRNA pseudouridine synthase A isoform X2 [Odontomachus brunneus]